MSNDLHTLTNSELDAEIATISRGAPNSAALERALAERGRRTRFMDAVLRAVRADLERAAILYDLDPVLDFIGPATVLRFGERGPKVLVAHGFDNALATCGTIHDALKTAAPRATPTPTTVSLRLPAAALGLVIDELDRASDREAYARLTLRGNTLSGALDDVRDLADGIDATIPDEELDHRAVVLAADSKGYPVGDALEARAKFIARALRRSRDTLLARLRRGR